MKQLYLLLITLAFCFLGCKNQKMNQNNFSKNSISVSDTEIQSLDGLWINNSYLLEIKKKHSIYITKDKYELIGFTMDNENLKSDSPSLFGFTSHEGGYDYPIIFDSIKGKYVSDTKRQQNIDPYFELNIINENLIQVYYPEKGKKINYKKCKKINDEYISLLFVGKYININNNTAVEIHNNGDIMGFSDTLHYIYVIDDFGLNINYDAIILTKQKIDRSINYNDGDLYKYVFKKDTLKLYSVKTDWEELKHSVDSIPSKVLIRKQ